MLWNAGCPGLILLSFLGLGRKSTLSSNKKTYHGGRFRAPKEVSPMGFRWIGLSFRCKVTRGQFEASQTLKGKVSSSLVTSTPHFLVDKKPTDQSKQPPKSSPANLVFFSDLHRDVFPTCVCSDMWTWSFLLQWNPKKRVAQIQAPTFVKKINEKKLKFKPAPSIAPKQKKQHRKTKTNISANPLARLRCFLKIKGAAQVGGMGRFVGIWFEMGVEGRKDVSQVEGYPVGNTHLSKPR